MRLAAAPMKLLLQGPPALRRQRLIPSARQSQGERSMTKTAPWRMTLARHNLDGLLSRSYYPSPFSTYPTDDVQLGKLTGICQ